MSDQLQVITALDQSINDAHDRAEGVGVAARDKFLEYANAVRELGLLLNVRRDQVRGGESKWCEMFATHHGKCSEAATFTFDYSWACKWMKLAKAHEHPFTSIEEVREHHKLIGVSVGLLEEGTRPEQNSHDFNFSADFGKIIGRLDLFWNKHKGDDFIASLPSHAREQLAEDIRPLREKIERIWQTVTA